MWKPSVIMQYYKFDRWHSLNGSELRVWRWNCQLFCLLMPLGGFNSRQLHFYSFKMTLYAVCVECVLIKLSTNEIRFIYWATLLCWSNKSFKRATAKRSHTKHLNVSVWNRKNVNFFLYSDCNSCEIAMTFGFFCILSGLSHHFTATFTHMNTFNLT